MTAGPAVSVVIVTCQRLAELQRCLAHLRTHLRQPGAPTAEVLTVHAPGDEAAIAAVLAGFPEVAVHRSPVRNLCAQRNQGARAANGAIVVFLDDDAWPRPGWLPALVAAFARPEVVIATGPVLFGNGRLQYGPMAVSPMVRPIALRGDAPLPAGMSPTVPGCNLAVRRRTLFQVGGFDERLSIHFDDVDFCMRVFAATGRRDGSFAFVGAASVHHEPAPGPFRRTRWDRDWRTVARDSIYLAFVHGAAHPWRRLWVPLLLQVPKVARFFAWLLRGRLGPVAFARCLGRHLLGLIEGFHKGLTARPRLPLAPLPEPVATPPPGATARTTPPACHARSD